MSAIEFASAGCRTLADNTLALTVHIEPRYAKQAFELFSKRGTPGAIAALLTAGQQEAQERPKGGAASQWLAQRCAEPEFQLWLADRWPKVAHDHHAAVDLDAADIVRKVLGVKSRAEIDHDPAAFERFETLIRRPWVARG